MSIHWKNPGFQVRATAIGILTLLCATVGAESNPSSPPTWKNLTKKELRQKLRQYSFAKVRSSLVSPLNYPEERVVFYSPCPDGFPKLEGDFPCSLLEWEETKRSTERDPIDEYREGGEISVFLSNQKSRLVNGLSVLLTPREKREGKGKHKIDPEDILIFYDTQSRISHYRVGNRVFLFRWKEEDRANTLKSILDLTLNSELYPESGREIDFSKF